MSNRTIIEINHDLWHRIEGDREGFGTLIAQFTRACDPEIREHLQRYGCNVLGTVHHSDKVTISFNKLT